MITQTLRPSQVIALKRRKRYSLEEICALYRVPPPLVRDYQKSILAATRKKNGS